ncbi:hypothetical protein NBRC10512_003088 [Rhodotorula toruloides]|uniref:RHTO0S05e10616g1_1 n=2 Tax=Rhodotorula toruloides TaxID=5286 RepID=A0A061B1Z5_RHOTO|nr:uncharacterized protein RHTO_06741 [Rhodotorula toruloides NP11]EMS23682.1 hypothetical protein RHTO_06741 [Rhodotorula toruloides NP11]CDR40996.1 RHTO0S05e10616g1_1 [Rhodotorula toruloides]
MDSQSTVLVHAVNPLTLDHAHALVHRIRTHKPRQRIRTDAAAPASASSDPDSLAPPPATASHIPWRIENKYYTADVAFRIIEHGEEGEGDEPAVIVLAESDEDPSTSTSLSSLLSSLSTRSPDPPEVALLVSILSPHPASSSPSSPTAEPDESAWEDLALSHGFEWVHLAHNEDDDEGLARIVGALQAHMWEGMERVEPVRPNGVRRAKSVTSEDEQGGEEEEGEWSALGHAPPLPEPRKPYGSTTTTDHLAFPPTFLPSIPRRAPVSNGVADAAHDSFDDDFAPFVSASASNGHLTTLDPHTPFPPFSSSPPSSSAAPSSPPSHLYRHPSFSFPDSHRPPSPDPDDDDGLEDLFSRISLARSRTDANVEGMGMGLEERREWAERVVRDLMGGLGSDEEDEDKVEGPDRWVKTR